MPRRTRPEANARARALAGGATPLRLVLLRSRPLAGGSESCGRLCCVPALYTVNPLKSSFKAFPQLRPGLQMPWNIREAIRRLSLLPGLAGLRASRFTAIKTYRMTVEGLNFSGLGGRQD